MTAMERWAEPPDLATTYMGLLLRAPLVASASPLNRDPEHLRRLERAGIGAIVLPSLFEEQVLAEQRWAERVAAVGSEASPEVRSYFPEDMVPGGAAAYLDLVRHAVETVRIPIIASLNGTATTGWTASARAIQEAGAQGLELNIYQLPTDLSLTGRAVEERHLEVLAAVRQAVSIPIAVKLMPGLSAPADLAARLDRGGAGALVLFNRHYLPDLDIVGLRSRSTLELSTKHEIRVPLLWISVLAGHLRGSLAASTGVETAEEVIKYLLAGADVVMTTSAVLRHGPDYPAQLLSGLSSWLAARRLDSVNAMRGLLSRRRAGTSAISERESYLEILHRW